MSGEVFVDRTVSKDGGEWNLSPQIRRGLLRYSQKDSVDDLSRYSAHPTYCVRTPYPIVSSPPVVGTLYNLQ